MQHFPSQLWADTPLASLYNDARVLAANTAETVTVPADAKAVIFSGTSGLGDFWVQFNGTAAAIPAADITDGTSPILNPGYVKGLPSTFSVISANAGILQMTWFDEPS